MATEERERVRGAAALVERDDGKGATAAGLPVDGDIARIGLWTELRLTAGGGERARQLTLIRLVSHAFLEMRRLS